MDKAKIGVIGLKGLPAFGGAATVGENIIGELKDKYNFTVYAVKSHTDQSGDLGGYRQIVFNNFFVKKLNVLIYYFKSLLHCLFASKYDLIHLHHVDGAFILPLLRLKYKVVCTSHAQPYVAEKWPGFVKVFFKLNEKIALMFSNSVTTVAKTLKDSYQARTKKQVHYIPNGINLNQKVEKQSPLSENYILFAAGRIIPLKGLHLLIQAFRNCETDKKLVIIGNLDQIPRYKDEILKLSEGLDIEFVSLIKEKGKLLAYVKNCDLFVFPSLSENMSIMLLEAASMKTHLVCSDISANTAVFDDSEALFFKSGDSEDLTEKMRYAIKEDGEMQQKAIRAYQRLTNEYDWGQIAVEYGNLFEKYLSKKV